MMEIKSEKTFKNLQKKTNNSKKKVQLKNVLADPCEKYWPAASGQEKDELLAKLKELHSSTKIGINNEENERNLKKSSSIVFGLEEVTRKLKRGDLEAVVLSGNIKPRFIIRQICSLAFNQREKAKIVIVPDLEEFLKEIFGFKSQTFGLSKIKEINEFPDLVNIISKISAKYPPPSVFNSKKSNPKIEIEEKKKSKSKLLISSINFDDLYLKKPEDGSRAFILHSTECLNTKTVELKQEKSKSSDFISINSMDMDVESTENDIELAKNRLKDSLEAAPIKEPIQEVKEENIDLNPKIEAPLKIFQKQKEENSSLFKINPSNKLSKNQRKKLKQAEKAKLALENPATYFPTKINRIQKNQRKAAKKESKKKQKMKNKK